MKMLCSTSSNIAYISAQTSVKSQNVLFIALQAFIVYGLWKFYVMRSYTPITSDGFLETMEKKEKVCLKQPSDVPLFISDYYLAIIELFWSWSYFGNQLKFSFQFAVLNNYSKKEKSFVLLHEIK